MLLVLVFLLVYQEKFDQPISFPATQRIQEELKQFPLTQCKLDLLPNHHHLAYQDLLSYPEIDANQTYLVCQVLGLMDFCWSFLQINIPTLP